MTKFEPINDSSSVVDRYASVFVESIKNHCENAAEKAVKEIVEDVTLWRKCNQDISEYQITYGLANNKGSVEKRNLFANCEFIRNESQKSWKKLSFWKGFSYREYEKECHEAVVSKISELIEEEFNKAEHKELLQNFNVEYEFRGYFSNGKRQYSKVVPLALCCLLPMCGWVIFCDEYKSTCESTYDGEALIHVSGKNPEQN
ncbi:MAG: hypothetical protein Q8K60_00900 [Parachlamydiaceae bacterium]|nr:hypothetical protein [Parachlamydiaceae bacterium]